MVDITHKSNSLRQAIASATVTVSRTETMDAIHNKKVPKGDIFEFSRAAGLLAVKKTSDVIPDCHPLPIEFASVQHHTNGLNIIITVEVHTIYKTGVEVEAMHGASVVALTIYDMLKPIDPSVEISSIRLESKKGGKSGRLADSANGIKASVIVCSDSVAAGKAEDQSGKRIVERLKALNIMVEEYQVIADDKSLIAEKAMEQSSRGYQLLIFTGGTGVSPRDQTPDAVGPLLEIPIPGIMEAARMYGQQRTPYAMLSRGVAGFIKNTLVMTLPGSLNAVNESMDALFPYVLHLFKVAQGMRHDEPRT